MDCRSVIADMLQEHIRLLVDNLVDRAKITLEDYEKSEKPDYLKVCHEVENFKKMKKRKM